MPRRLRLPSIEPIPKEVLFLEPLSRRVTLSDDQERFFLRIIRAIEAGRPLPDGAYRTSARRDDLLETLGVMHLHLGNAGSAELLYLVQYPDHVVFIQVGSHEHFSTKPVGRIIEQTLSRRLRHLQEWRRRQQFLKAPKPGRTKR